jgi:phage terminase large subunit
LFLTRCRTEPHNPGTVEEILSELEDHENHAVDALRYAVEGQRRGGYDSSMKWV